MGALCTRRSSPVVRCTRESHPIRRSGRGRRPAILADLGTPLLIHQPSYSMFNRWIEGGLLDTLGEIGVGCIAFSPLAQGMLTGRYLGGRPGGLESLAPGIPVQGSPDRLRPSTTSAPSSDIAAGRGQTPGPDGSVVGAPRDTRVTSVLVGASSVKQLEDNIGAVDGSQHSATRNCRSSSTTPWNRASTSGSLRAQSDRKSARSPEWTGEGRTSDHRRCENFL